MKTFGWTDHEIDLYIKAGELFQAKVDADGAWFIDGGECGYESNHVFKTEGDALGWLSERKCSVAQLQREEVGV